MVAAENFQLVGQIKVGKILLKLVQFGESAGSFWHPCGLVELPSQAAL